MYQRYPVYSDIGEPATLGGLAVYLTKRAPASALESRGTQATEFRAATIHPLSEVIRKLAERPKLGKRSLSACGRLIGAHPLPTEPMTWEQGFKCQSIVSL